MFDHLHDECEAEIERLTKLHESELADRMMYEQLLLNIVREVANWPNRIGEGIGEWRPKPRIGHG